MMEKIKTKYVTGGDNPKLFFTSDWHVSETSAPNTHSFLRPRPTSVMVHEWLKECNEKIKSDDTLVFVGDLTVELSKENIELLTQLPQCNKILVLGDKEIGRAHV